jgi:hypothetical protein
MGIKEKDLQTVQQLNDGDFIRVVTANGNSKKVDKNAVGGGNAFVVTISQHEFGGTATADKTYAEIEEAFQQGKDVRGILNRVDGTVIYGMAMNRDPIGIHGYFIEPYFENGAITKFRVQVVGMTESGVVEVKEYDKL